jgi:hypothetical protein
MICYLKCLNEKEVSAINEYWDLSDENIPTFRYTVNEVNKRCRSENVQAIGSLIKKSNFLMFQSRFECQECKKIYPAKNRSEFIKGIERDTSMVCSECLDKHKKLAIENARNTLKEYRDEHFQPLPYLENLSFEEALLLLALLEGQPSGDQYLGRFIADLTITGRETIDSSVLLSLIDQKALIYNKHLPDNIESANNLLFEEYRRHSCRNRLSNPVTYRNPDSLASGVFLRPLEFAEGVEVLHISSLLYQKLQLSALTAGEVARIHQIIKEVQLEKLYQLVMYVGKEKQIPIDNSRKLQSLLIHLSEHYPPQKLFYTFTVKAEEAIVYMHTQKSPGYIARNYFTSFVGNYIQTLEERNYELKKIRPLPPEIEAYSFEALFSELFLDGHFDWNRLSVKEVIAIWLENVGLADETSRLFAESDD